MGTQKHLFDPSIPETGPIALCPACGYTGYTLIFHYEEEQCKCAQCYSVIYDPTTEKHGNSKNN